MPLYYLVLSLLLVLPQVLQAQECSTAGLQPYRNCVLNNSPCPCGACDPDPTDGSTVLVTPPPRNCDDVYRIFCGLVRCCSVCEAEARAWYQACSANPFAEQTLGYTCELECEFQPFLDQCVPTSVPTFRPTRSPTLVLPTVVPTAAPVELPVSSEATVVTTTVEPSTVLLLTVSPTVSSNSTGMPSVLTNPTGMPPVPSSATRRSRTWWCVLGTFIIVFTGLRGAV